MLNGKYLLAILCLTVAASAFADIPVPKPVAPIRLDAPPPDDMRPPRPRLLITCDGKATVASLILPAKLSAAAKATAAPRIASTLPNAAVGLALCGTLVSGGLWLMRRPCAKVTLGVILLACGFATVGLAVYAQTPWTETRPQVERCKVRISRGGDDFQLILPPRVAPIPSK